MSFGNKVSSCIWSYKGQIGAVFTFCSAVILGKKAAVILLYPFVVLGFGCF